MKIFLILLAVFFTACDSKSSHGWKTVECFNEGKIVYSATYEYCPSFAGTGYSKLESGKIIKAELVNVGSLDNFKPTLT